MDFKQYKGKNILAWLWFDPDYNNYNPGKANTVCYVYPRLLVGKETVNLIDPSDFPQHGAIRVNIYGGETAKEVADRFGPFVSLKINKDDSNPDYEGNNMYSLRYNPKFGKTNSEIWIDEFSGRNFYQIIDINSSMEVLQKERSIPIPDFQVYTTLILLRYKNKLYGPFECGATKEEKIPLNGIKDFQYSIGEYDTINYNNDLFAIKNQEGEDVFILIPKTLIPSPEECEIRYDWISERILIDDFMNFLRTENSYTHRQVGQIKEMIRKFVESSAGVQFTEERIAKIQTLLRNIVQKSENVRDVVEYALLDEDVKRLVAEEVVNNYFDQIQDKVLEVSSVQERINGLKEQETNLQKRVDILQKRIEQGNAKSSEEDKLRISELTQENNKLRQTNKTLNEKIGLQKEIETLKLERDKLKKERDQAKDSYNQQLLDNNELEKQFSATLDSFNNRAKQTARILDNKLLDKILRGIGEEPSIENIVPFDISLLHTGPMNATDIINRVTEFISEKAHRDVTFNDVANYLICITQGFITTFAGEPGTGKTSLCNILAKALGLVADIPQRRFVDISVERGWSSHKDFIGYYNPLSKRMERSNGEAFEAFERMDREYDCDQSRIAPFIVLLDEANLSPIEHYWAAFLRNCDFASMSNRSISLGGTKSFKLPEHLRFLATVNFDHTTEELSPRFLDRSWVIMLEPTRVNDEIDEDVENFKDMVSFDAMKAAFCIQEDDAIDEAVQNKWNDIQRIFRERALQIMPRNLKMVRNYCAVGCRCMERDTPVTKFAPLDYALSQKILPTINGNGENYRMLIEDLLAECTAQNMPISAKHLERMKRIAESNMGFYQFFSR